MCPLGVAAKERREHNLRDRSGQADVAPSRATLWSQGDVKKRKQKEDERNWRIVPALLLHRQPDVNLSAEIHGNESNDLTSYRRGPSAYPSCYVASCSRSAWEEYLENLDGS